MSSIWDIKGSVLACGWAGWAAYIEVAGRSPQREVDNSPAAAENAGMIRRCSEADIPAIEVIINEAASAYRGVIPEDCWHEPYMQRSALVDEISKGVEFWGCEEGGSLAGVMGFQNVRDVTLIRHAYVRPSHQSRGVGGALLAHLVGQTTKPLLVGTWASAHWAIRFYERHGFRLVGPEEKDRLLTTYWDIPVRQRETSVVLKRARG